MSFSSKSINVEQLIYDPQNPRLPSKMKDMDEDATLDYMLRNGNITELMESIAELGYSSAEPLLVVKAAVKEKYLVVEGNRRLTALKLLNDPLLAKVRKQIVIDIAKHAKVVPSEIPCILYDSREEILNYLGYRHITGIKEWGSLEKAKYLKELFEANIDEGDEIYKTLAKMIGSRSDYVERLLTAYELYCYANDKAYFGSAISEEDINFSYYTTALGYKSILLYLNISLDKSHNHLADFDQDHYKSLFLWLFDPKKRVIKENRQISTMAKILESEEAIDKLQSGASLEVARLYTTEPGEIFVAYLSTSLDALTAAKFSIEQLSDIPSGYADMLQNIEKTIKSIRGAVEENFASDSEKENVSLTRDEYEKVMALVGNRQQ